ncbi:phosphonate C-P lyase system protein PhnH [Paroceanicella profunda]|uniref:Phosphonate C-P lyase system protein PhnH n=1 Tax=Paroceanicella profunda TaxID=2579971 RepID=A0A5B8FSZ8_9RHOB|nr:phosphonate C-P lyase system protein PhnH [Paroceanicella profunda]QDL91866.1 phosphonate C-P lyase system protein PhnH [Paroceanicella profunda]
MQAETLSGGFGDTARDAARAFRAVLDAMARPGTLHTLAGVAPPAPLPVASGAVALTMCDPETPVWLAPSLATPQVEGWLRFHTGAPLAPRDEAMFAFGGWEEMLPLDDFAIGTAEFPDRSATLVVSLPELAATGARLTGPGIREAAALSLPETAAFARNALLYPLGLDFIFTCGSRLAALPRTTIVEG